MMRILSSILALPLLTSMALGQCMVGNANAPQSNGTGVKIGHSFTPTCNGDIEYVEIFSTTGGMNTAGTLKIFNGETVLGTPIHTQAYPATMVAAGQALRIYLSAPIAATAFAKNTFELDMSIVLPFSGGNPYPGGRLFYNHSNGSVHANSDLKFNASMISNCTNSNSSITADACQEYTSPSGMTWTSTGMFMDTISNASGCDSVITVDLSVTTLDTTVTLSGLQLTSNESNATYQWLDCDNGNAPISGADQQTYTATTSGNYAVQLTANNCTEVSDCWFVGSTGITDDPSNTVKLWPNPTTGIIQLSGIPANSPITIMDVLGNRIAFDRHLDRVSLTDPTSGIHFLQYTDPNGGAHNIRFLVK